MLTGRAPEAGAVVRSSSVVPKSRFWFLLQLLGKSRQRPLDKSHKRSQPRLLIKAKTREHSPRALHRAESFNHLASRGPPSDPVL